MRERIQAAVSVLIGLPLIIYRRSGGVDSFQFGAKIESTTFAGNASIVGTYVLNVQCPWRITQDGRIVVGSSDAPHSIGISLDDPAKGHNRSTLECSMSRLFEESRQQLVVTGIDAKEAGLLFIRMESDLSLDIFPESAAAGESWRLFRSESEDEHFVVSGDRITG